jgi:hypothetical protein
MAGLRGQLQRAGTLTTLHDAFALVTGFNVAHTVQAAEVGSLVGAAVLLDRATSAGGR